MEEVTEFFQNNKVEDITWFCSLSESELDFLISLKKLAIQRAKISGHEEIAENFDLKMLGALGLVLMEHVRKRIQFDNSNDASSVVHQLMLLDNCDLLRHHVEDTKDIEDILTGIYNNKSRRKLQKRRR